MKFAGFVVAVALLFAGSSFAQQVRPASSTLEAVPSYTSPAQEVTFYNTGESKLMVTVSIEGPFAMPENLCGGEVKPQEHCGVWVTYTAEAMETQTGSLTFTFNGQAVAVPLSGQGMDLIPTTTKMQCELGTCKKRGGGQSPVFVIRVSAGKGYEIPDGEEVDVNCVEYLGPYKGAEAYGTGALEDGKTQVALHLPYPDEVWHCYAKYNGDGFFGPSSAEIHTVH